MIRTKIIIAVTVVFMLAAGVNCIAAPRGLGEVPAGGFKSPEGNRLLTSENGAKPLNNLVFELLNVESPGITDHIFRNPREGWVYICVPKPKTGAERQPVVILDEQTVALRAVGDVLETMRYLMEGPHTVGIARSGGTASRLEVRAIGELFYAAYGSNPHIPEAGNYTWDFLRRHCLDSFNSMIGENGLTPDGKSKQEAEIKEWTDQGKRWFTLHSVPDGIRAKATETVDQAYDYWTNTLGMQHPLISGIFADEFGPRQEKYFPIWAQALRRIHADPRFANRQFYAYVPNRFWPIEETNENGQNYKVMYPFIQAIEDCGYRFAPEWYQVEGWSRPGRIIEKTEDLQSEFGPGWEMASRESYERACPGAATNRVIIMSILSEPGQETSDLFANYDYNVFLDAQMQFVATDPAFFAARGIQGYLSSYCGEEQLRLFARLLRHYAIEGRTDRVLKDPYVLTHLQNPDFMEGTSGWSLEPAGESGIAAKTVPGLGTIEAKYHAPEGTGDKAVWTKRSAQKPNLISQEIQNLVPGRVYSLRFYTADYKEFVGNKSEKRKHAVSARIENVDMVPEKCFQAVISGGYWYPYGAFNRDNLYWLNYHQQVFRAKGKTARLVLSDWASEQSAGGLEGEEMLWNFIQVQPYVE